SSTYEDVSVSYLVPGRKGTIEPRLLFDIPEPFVGRVLQELLFVLDASFELETEIWWVDNEQEVGLIEGLALVDDMIEINEQFDAPEAGWNRLRLSLTKKGYDVDFAGLTDIKSKEYGSWKWHFEVYE
ncbi:MAG: hypothetical protein ABEI86_12050, partial [Halobacteriaceae archaeon]